VKSGKATAEDAQRRLQDTEALVTTLRSRVEDLQAELDEVQAACVAESVCYAHSQTDASLLEPITAEVRICNKRPRLVQVSLAKLT
jgi:predicted transcriptional regulator